MTPLAAAARRVRSFADRVAPRLPSEGAVAAGAFDGALGATAWFVPATLLVVGTPLPIIGLLGGVWLVLGRPEHGERLLAEAALGGPLARRALAVVGLAFWTLGPTLAPPTGFPVWSWFAVGLLGVAPYGGVDTRPDAVRVLVGSAVGPTVALLVLVVLLAAGGLVAGLQAAFAVTVALGTLALALGVPASTGDAATLSTRDLVDAGRRLPAADRRLLAADCWTRAGLAVVGPLFVAFSVQRLGDGFADGSAVVAACLAVAAVGAAGANRALPRVRSLGAWTAPLLATFGLGVATTAPLAVLLAPATPLAFAGTFLAVGVGQVGWTVLDEQVADALGDPSATYRGVRSLLLVPAALVGGVLFAVAPPAAFVLSSVAGAVGTVTYLRRVAR